MYNDVDRNIYKAQPITHQTTSINDYHFDTETLLNTPNDYHFHCHVNGRVTHIKLVA